MRQLMISISLYFTWCHTWATLHQYG